MSLFIPTHIYLYHVLHAKMYLFIYFYISLYIYIFMRVYSLMLLYPVSVGVRGVRPKCFYILHPD